ncbi:MAG: cytochrome c biogenesis protein ResB [Bacteroidales bacterium]|nr:cytochrome c biogenesis protein ResB [Bacteroidales bacterium]
MKKSFLKLAIIIPIILFFVGITLQGFLGDFPLQAFKFPINIIVFADVFISSIVLHWLFKNKNFIKFLSSGYAALSSIALFSAMVIIMVSTAQENTDNTFIKFFGFNNVIFTWTYALSSFYLLISLGLATLRRLFPFTTKNIFFYLNHFGFWLIVAAGSLGQADKQRLNISVPEGELVWYAHDSKGKYQEPDFAIKLDSFKIKYYPPKLAIVDIHGNMLKAKEFQPKELIKGEKIKYKAFNIEVLDIYENAIATKDTVLFVAGLPENTVVAKLKVNNKVLYIQNGTSFHNPILAKISAKERLAILSPEPSYFGSYIGLYTKTGIKNEKHLIEVNKPLIMKSWTIYQTSYFKLDDYSQDVYVSVLTAVYDPWLKIVYLGFAMLVIGVVYLIFSRPSLKIKK